MTILPGCRHRDQDEHQGSSHDGHDHARPGAAHAGQSGQAGACEQLGVAHARQAVVEAERNLEAKLPATLPAFRLIVSRCLRVTADPTLADLAPHVGLATPSDLPILVAALREGCPWLVTFNVRHYRPGHPLVTILRPGDFTVRVRDLLAGLASEGLV